MTGKVFISCGQRSGERQIAKKLFTWFKKNDFNPYVAIEAQSIQDVNSGIINELNNSDFYVFVDFRREELNNNSNKDPTKYRGSLFTNQELAIAYYLGFEKVIFFQESGIVLEGLLQYMLSNMEPNETIFYDYCDLLKKVKIAVRKREWKPTYTRHLTPDNLRWSGEINHTDNVGNNFQHCKVLQIDIKNNRDNISAFNTVARLEYIEINGNKNDSPDRTLLKATDQSIYNQVIWQNNHCTFDLLMIEKREPHKLYLLSAKDSKPREEIIAKQGIYNLYYSVVAVGFPLLNFVVNINHKGDYDKIEIELVQQSNGV